MRTAPAPPRPSKRPRHGHEAAPSLPDEVIVEHILTRVPAAATVRFRAVCWDWRAALTSDHFVQAYQAARAAAQPQPPEIFFFAPGAAADSTFFYSLKFRAQQDASSPARELVTVGDLRANDLVLSGTKPCRGLTLLYQPGESAYHVCNLSTGEDVSLPPCEWAIRVRPYGPHVLSSTGLGFYPAADEHIVVRLFEDWRKQQRCEVYGLRSGGWRPLAGRAPPHAAKGLDGRPPVFVDGCFYWHIYTRTNFSGREEHLYRTPEPILSLSVDTERFGWVALPEVRARYVFHLAELDGQLCARWWTPASPSNAVGAAGRRPDDAVVVAALPHQPGEPAPADEGSPEPRHPDAPARLVGRKILLATSRHEVHAYDPESNSMDTVFSVQEFIDAPREPVLLLNIAMHEETVTGIRRRRGQAEDEARPQHCCPAGRTFRPANRRSDCY
ncbi:LOW QUALITY PROTEIN: hypothetical protein GQ55_1G082000 [Panicum hallii var. hallii]|uniref:F-box domain-containing protein n=1 Tax=Panicum hallii var. hallii TaxID=1504633 RepID=A0A2T7F3I3_9POAL|nr:LOW QUALITY PROTEIN: hypothetical protein GQ55_1G082000 [Panicum hallii var. hallii]